MLAAYMRPLVKEDSVECLNIHNPLVSDQQLYQLKAINSLY